eukprot:Skav200194  [mRNA]  locus=scaffold2383:277048:290106:- [translate_table: standard]
MGFLLVAFDSSTMEPTSWLDDPLHKLVTGTKDWNHLPKVVRAFRLCRACGAMTSCGAELHFPTGSEALKYCRAQLGGLSSCNSGGASAGAQTSPGSFCSKAAVGSCASSEWSEVSVGPLPDGCGSPDCSSLPCLVRSIGLD